MNSHFQDFETTNNVTEDSDEFINWYKVKMRDINQLMGELVKESKYKHSSKFYEEFINIKSDEWIQLKKELDKIRSLHDEEYSKIQIDDINYPIRKSSDSLGSIRYFSTNPEQKEPNKYESKHEYGVLKRNPQTSSTPSFKPNPQNFHRQVGSFSSNGESIPMSDTIVTRRYYPPIPGRGDSFLRKKIS